MSLKLAEKTVNIARFKQKLNLTQPMEPRIKNGNTTGYKIDKTDHRKVKMNFIF